MATYGADPEFACISSTSMKADVIPPAALIEDHGLPFTVNDNNKRVLYTSEYHGTVIEDGAAVELNVNPCSNLIAVRNSIQNLLQEFTAYLRTKNLRFTIAKTPIGYFDVDKYWKGRGPSFHDCVRFGCDPDFFPEYYKEIGLEKENPHEIDVSKHNTRYFGGHIHIGSDAKFDMVFSPIVFDFCVGLLNASIFRTDEQRKSELKRLEFYGHPGRGRIQPWGYEYRPPSNYWAYSTDAVVSKLQTAVDLAETIVRRNLHRDFFFFAREYIPEMWNACVTLNSDRAKYLYSNVTFPFVAENGLVKLSQVKNVINIEYI